MKKEILFLPPYQIKITITWENEGWGLEKCASDFLYNPTLKEGGNMASKNYKDLKKVKAMFKEIDTEKSEIVLSLVDKAIFLEDVLKELKQKVKQEGTTTQMCQGSYSIERENPALKSYNTTFKNYQAVMKQIADLVEHEISNNKRENKEEDEFDKFCDGKC